VIRSMGLAALMVAMAACGTAAPDLRATDLPTDGQGLFEARAMGNRPGCITCHSTEPGEDLVGPSLAGVGQSAASRVEGMDPERYLRQSIVDPDAHLVEGYKSGLMPGDLVTILSDEQIQALIDYMEGL